MSRPSCCPTCGSELPSDAPLGLCPLCLMGHAATGMLDPSSLGEAEGTEAGENRQESASSPSTVRPGSADPEPTTVTGRAPELVAAGAGAGRCLGDYELIQAIARGGMGIVYRARQISLNQDVAVKLIRSAQLAAPEEVRRFRAEAEAVAWLDHPHIEPIYEVGEHQGEHYFSMKLIEGGSLARHGPGLLRDPKRAARILTQVARTVHAAHQRGILHRDLKPENILLDVRGEPHVTDFGPAMSVQGDARLTLSGMVRYAQLHGAGAGRGGMRELLTTSSDVYSLGAVLYFLLTGRPPFRGESMAATLRQVEECEPSPPRAVNPRVDRDLETIALRCLQKEPRRRYGSAEALAEDLERRLRGEPIAARPISTGERLVKWARRKPAIAALGAAVVVVAVLGLLSVIGQWRVAMANWREARDNQARASRIAAEARAHAERARQNEQKAVAALLEAIEAKERVEAQRDQLRRDQSVMTMTLAHHLWQIGDVPHARSMLRKWASPDGSDLRRWEWHYLNRLSRFGQPAWAQHDGNVLCVASRPDGRLLASGGADRTVRLWDLKTQKLVRTLPHDRAVFSVAFSPDGRRLASASQDRTVRLWTGR